MNIQKTIAIVTAIGINVAVLAWFSAWSTPKVASVTPPAAPAHAIVTLPVITVTPSAEQLRELHKPPVAVVPAQTGAAGDAVCLVMPYYSFAAACDGTAKG